MAAFLTALLLSATSTPALTPTLTPAAPGRCPAAAPVPTRDGAAGRQPLERLDRLPSPHHYLTVLKAVDGCPVVVVKYEGRTYDVGAPDQAAPLMPLDATPHRR